MRHGMRSIDADRVSLYSTWAYLSGELIWDGDKIPTGRVDDTI